MYEKFMNWLESGDENLFALDGKDMDRYTFVKVKKAEVLRISYKGDILFEAKDEKGANNETKKSNITLICTPTQLPLTGSIPLHSLLPLPPRMG